MNKSAFRKWTNLVFHEENSVPSVAADRGLMSLLQKPARPEALAPSSEGIMFWRLQGLHWLHAAVNSSSATARPVSGETKPKDGMQHGWKKERTAPASFPGQSGAEVWLQKDEEEESLEADFCLTFSIRRRCQISFRV